MIFLSMRQLWNDDLVFMVWLFGSGEEEKEKARKKMIFWLRKRDDLLERIEQIETLNKVNNERKEFCP